MIETIFMQVWSLALPGRAIAGALFALIIAGAAWRAGSLGQSGFVAAVACGTVSAIGGWKWAILLILYFVAASLLSRVGEKKKEARTLSVVSKGGRRDAAQVLANGGVYSVAAALTIVSGAAWLVFGAVGALAASSADSWATELGTWLGDKPRSIIYRTIVRTGESGAVSLAGSVGSVAGAAWVALIATVMGFPRGLGIASIVAGVGGSITDSLLGATLQERRWCDVCAEPTERVVHLCGCATRHTGGIRKLDNDVVNLLSTFAGFLLGVIGYCIARNFGNWGAID